MTFTFTGNTGNTGYTGLDYRKYPLCLFDGNLVLTKEIRRRKTSLQKV